ncbi:lipid II:glycine glycyltransferase (peptidoglycan interpeptide bridge formation enzyme) [Arthrobacter silviterrae]|uniref:Aminoacyltransferase n=1 Tax=Arthrobacter silviterrae TaxID=2026658 RepID=A0ABX0DAV3_9MICC|nr:peptidoglycan bridge formation glycyltransferase FemA/FemB family protein [Arthrobacter silviterrae]MDQ0278941.1 lipid II:glycine glycyltransferase (peptidoglycan interpeptide bridge formation enzyme) [Arthrobacter silviterrae]NGN84044.1 aminoacyltransferase [Arthrobacter silviterrae]
MEYSELTAGEFDTFVDSQATGSFMQSSMMGARRDGNGWTMRMVGVKHDGAVVAAALLSSRNVLGGFADVECLQGPVLDYRDAPLRTFFFTRLEEDLKAHKVLSFTFNPKLLANHRDQDANIIDDGYTDADVVQALAELGFEHQDNTEVDANPLYLRWYFAKDLTGIATPEQLLAGFDGQATRSVKKVLKSPIEVSALAEDELDQFFAVMRHTGERRGFDYRDEDYYRSLAHVFGPEHIEFLVARLDVERYEGELAAQVKTDSAALEKARAALEAAPDNAKNAKRLAAAEQTWGSSQAKLADLPRLREDGPQAVLTAAVFITFAGETVFLAGGSYDHYSHFHASYALHWHALQEAMARGIRRYNFYGTKGEFSNNPEQHGVYRFKRGFGGVVEEQTGYFTSTPNKAAEKARETVSVLRGAVGSLRSKLSGK